MDARLRGLGFGRRPAFSTRRKMTMFNRIAARASEWQAFRRGPRHIGMRRLSINPH